MILKFSSRKINCICNVSIIKVNIFIIVLGTKRKSSRKDQLKTITSFELITSHLFSMELMIYFKEIKDEEGKVCVILKESKHTEYD